VRDALGHRRARLGHGAQRSDAPGELAGLRSLRLQQRAQSQQHVGQRLAGPGAVGRQLEAPQRPGDLAAARRPAADQRQERAQLVLLLGRHDADAARLRATADREGLPRAAAGPRPRRARQHDAGRVVEAQAGQQPAQPDLGVAQRRLVAGRGLPRQPGEHDLVAVVAGGAQRLRGGVVARVGAHEREALAERDLVGGERQAHDRGDHLGQRPALHDDALELLVGAREPLGAQLEVAAVLEHARQEVAQRLLGARPRLGRERRLPARDEVGVQAAAGGERVHGGQERCQPPEHRPALVDEVGGERAVAVQRRLAAVAAELDDLERDLGAVGRVGGELEGGLLGERGKRCMQLAVAHGGAVRPRAPRSCSAHAALQAVRPVCARGGASARRARA
jgi:hypothetical protein